MRNFVYHCPFTFFPDSLSRGVFCRLADNFSFTELFLFSVDVYLIPTSATLPTLQLDDTTHFDSQGRVSDFIKPASFPLSSFYGCSYGEDDGKSSSKYAIE